MPPFLKLIGNLIPLILALGLTGWGLWRWLKSSDAPLDLVIRWLVTAVVMGFVILNAARAKDEASKIVALLVGCVGGILMTLTWRQKFCDFVGDLFASLYTGGNEPVEPKPFYSIAEAKRKQGKYLEAIALIREQLAMFPTDFTGWMLIAEIQAENLNDIPAATETVATLLAQEGHASKNIAYALNRQADWFLNLGRDRDGAQAALERIVELLPETEQAQMALQRMARLTPPEMLAKKQEPHRFAVPKAEENLGLRMGGPKPPAAEADPAALAGEYVQRLNEFPHDADTREKLAMIYARHYQRVDMATDQLEQLISSPNQPTKRVVHWLNLLADLHLQASGDADLAREILHRIIDLYPKTAAAENAVNRIAHLKLETRPKQLSQAIKLGSYEQNIGLKRARPAEVSPPSTSEPSA